MECFSHVGINTLPVLQWHCSILSLLQNCCPCVTHWPESEEAFPSACNRKMAQFRDFQADSGKISPLLSSSSIVTMPPWGSVPLGGGSPMAVTPGNLYHLQVPQRALVLLNILLYFFFFPSPPPPAPESFDCFTSICPFKAQPLQDVAGGGAYFFDIQKCARPLSCHLERSNDSRGFKIMTLALRAGGSG